MDDNQFRVSIFVALIGGLPALIAAGAAAILGLRNGWTADHAVKQSKEAKLVAEKGVEQNVHIIEQNKSVKEVVEQARDQANGSLADALRRLEATQNKLETALTQIVDLTAAKAISELAMKELRDLAEREARHSRRNEEHIQVIQKQIAEWRESHPVDPTQGNV